MGPSHMVDLRRASWFPSHHLSQVSVAVAAVAALSQWRPQVVVLVVWHQELVVEEVSSVLGPGVVEVVGPGQPEVLDLVGSSCGLYWQVVGVVDVVWARAGCLTICW